MAITAAPEVVEAAAAAAVAVGAAAAEEAATTAEEEAERKYMTRPLVAFTTSLPPATVTSRIASPNSYDAQRFSASS